ncbi:trypsin-like peptidase domain-containing protein [Streptomyces sp. NPDC020096]
MRDTGSGHDSRAPITTQSWQARVTCGREVGAGFLITDRHVMTCAHVVRHDDRATVYFAGRGGLGSVDAEVELRGDWAGAADDAGDVAVLRLARPVPITPAAFANPSAAYEHPARKLVAYGFPRGYDEGILGEFRATAAQLIADEWAQLETWTGHGQPLAEGFSGSAAVLEDSGAVAGMISAAADDARVRVGRMVPVHVLARYWPRAAELIPTPGFGPAAKRELRDLVARVPAVDATPECLYAEAVGPLGPAHPARGFRSLWEAAWYLVSEVSPHSGTAPAAEFARALAARVADPDVRRGLQTWARGHRGPGCPVPGRGRHQWSPILVEIDRSGADRNTFLVEVSAFRDGHRRVVGTRTLPKAKVRGYVLERIDEAFRELDPSGDELIAFAVPREWLNQPIDRWERSRSDPSPLGCFSPVVVMDLDRRRSGGLQHKIQKKWEILDKQPASPVHRVRCGSRENPVQLTVRLGSSHDVVGFGSTPKSGHAKRLLAAGLNAAVPVMLWSRSGCPDAAASADPHGDGCVGNAFLDTLAEELAALSPSELPQYVQRLREQAFVHSGPDPHWAEQITLMWEDPRWFPDIPDYIRSPVS